MKVNTIKAKKDDIKWYWEAATAKKKNALQYLFCVIFLNSAKFKINIQK